MALNKKLSACLTGLGLVLSLATTAQKKPVKYWVMFTDKNNSPYSLSQPSAFLTQAAQLRRTTYNIPYHISDLPVNPSYIAQVEALSHSKVLYASKWFNGVVIAIDSSDWKTQVLNDLAALNFVAGTRHVKRYKIDAPLPALQDPGQDGTYRAAGTEASTFFQYGRSKAQIEQLGLDCLHDKGYRGQGMTISVVDAGFGFVNSNPIYDSLWARNGVLGTRDFADGDLDVYSHSTHGSMVLSCLAANAPGKIVGTAPLANYWLLRTEEGPETISEEYNWIRAAEFSDSVGADIITTSLGYTQFDDPAMNHTYQDLDGRTAPMSIAATMAARKGMLVLNAAGNERANTWHYISVPADADSILAVGSVDSLGKDSPYSGVGPTADGRIKPDLVCMGEATWVAIDQVNGFPGNGTSFACPVMAGAAACYWQAYRQHDNMTILRSLKLNADKAKTPDNLKGYGVPNVCASPVLGLADQAIMDRFDFTAYSIGNGATMLVEVSNINYDYLQIEITDLLGKSHLSQDVEINKRLIKVDAESLAEGIYIITVRSSQGTLSKKVLKY